MSKFEDTIQFDIQKKVGDIEIIYSNLIEIVQGGPVTGNLSINSKTLEGRYGGPCLYKEGFVYAPAHVKKYIGTGFKLARINTSTMRVEYFGKTKDLIYLDKINENQIYFYEDMDKTIYKLYEL